MGYPTFPAKPGPHDLDQITLYDAILLREMAKDKRCIIDVGTFLGASAEALLQGMPEDGAIITIDTFRGIPETVTADIHRHDMLRYALERLEPFADRLVVMVGESVQCASALPREFADLVFLDASHDYFHIRNDIEAWLPVVKPDGLLAGHDLEWEAFDHSEEHIIDHSQGDSHQKIHFGVARAVSEAFGKIQRDSRSSIWAARPQWKREDYAEEEDRDTGDSPDLERRAVS